MMIWIVSLRKLFSKDCLLIVLRTKVATIWMNICLVNYYISRKIFTKFLENISIAKEWWRFCRGNLLTFCALPRFYSRNSFTCKIVVFLSFFLSSAFRFVRFVVGLPGNPLKTIPECTIYGIQSKFNRIERNLNRIEYEHKTQGNVDDQIGDNWQEEALRRNTCAKLG